MTNVQVGRVHPSTRGRPRTPQISGHPSFKGTIAFEKVLISRRIITFSPQGLKDEQPPLCKKCLFPKPQPLFALEPQRSPITVFEKVIII